MKTKKHRLIWVDIHEKENEVTPWYYFDFDKLNRLGFSDPDIYSFIKEIKKMAKKEINERLESEKSIKKIYGQNIKKGEIEDEKWTNFRKEEKVS